ncbi:type II secretion system F family protein [Neobacillus muris]|uniref:type II secretion system F family protein n=1 Tax=Neobacillus muris TaxID=2941334 RepID=UPI00203DD2C8|nr:type II secretion system F family protein [Neobacillus muris]
MVILIFICSFLVFGLIGSRIFNRKNYMAKRLEKLIPNSTRPELMKAETAVSSKNLTVKDIIEKISNHISLSDKKRKRLETELQGAGIQLKVEEFIAIRTALLTTGIICIAAGVPIVVSILIGLFSWKLPSLYVKKKKEKRIAASGEQLPQALETMANALKSGFSFMQAMQVVSKEMPDPIGIEFKRTLKEMNLGVSTEVAFENLLERLPNRDLEIVVTAVLIQRTTGGNLAQILETIHETISERVRLKDEMKALTSQGRMSALVITLLPVFMGIILSLLNPGYFDPMLSHPLGQILLGGGVVSGILGWIFIQKVVTIEV